MGAGGKEGVSGVNRGRILEEKMGCWKKGNRVPLRTRTAVKKD